MQVSKLRRWPH